MGKSHSKNQSLLPQPNGFIQASENVQNVSSPGSNSNSAGVRGAIDTIFSGAGANWRTKHLENFINILSQKLGCFTLKKSQKLILMSPYMILFSRFLIR